MSEPIRFKPITEVGSWLLGTRRFIVEHEPHFYIDEEIVARRNAMIEWCDRMIDPTWFGRPVWVSHPNKTQFEFSRSVDAMGFYMRFQGAYS